MRKVLTLAFVLGWVLGPGATSAGAAEPSSTEAPRPAAEAPAAPKLVVVWPTLTPAGDDASPAPLHRPTSLDEPLATHAHELDATLRDATQDLGFVLDLADPGPPPTHVRDLDLVARAGRGRPGEPSGTGTWVVSARLEAMGGDSFLLRLVVVRPNGKELRTRVEVVKGADVSLRGLVLLRDLLSPDVIGRVDAGDRERHADTGAAGGLATPARSPGRAVLATNGALFGGYVGYSLVRSTGSGDPRVLYPLLTLGTVVGIGGALLASEEWDIGTGDAWFLSTGAWWGAGSGLLIAYGTNAQPSEGPYAWGIGGGLAGIALGTFALSRRSVDDGGAVLTNSGAALGLLVGGLVELGYRETTSVTPYSGAGIGSAIGLVGAGAASMFVTVPPSRVLLIDLGAGVGSLAGAAAGSPLIFSDLTGAKTSGTDTRLFLAGTLAGTVVGGTVAWYLTRTLPAKTTAWLGGMPNAGVIGQSQTPTGQVPVYGVAYSGGF
jgi:hypothetical protein